MKERILVITSTFPRYEGDTTPSFVYDYAKNISDAFEVIILAPFDKTAKTFEKKDNLTIYRYKYLPFNPGSLAYEGGIGPKLRQSPLNYFQVPFFLFFQLLNIIKLVKKYNMNIIHSHWILPQGLVAVIYKIFFNKKIKLLCTAHGADIYGFKSPFSSLLKRFIIKNSDSITCVSNALKQEVVNLYEKDNIRVIPMGIDTARFDSAKYNHTVKEKYKITAGFLLFTGRLVEKKGLYYLIKAFPEVLKEFPDIKLLIIGDGPEKTKLLELTKDLNLNKNIIFTGAVLHKNLPGYFAAADIFIGPSITVSSGDSEGFGLVFAEALSCQTPVITTDLPAIADIVQNNINGFAVEQKNSKQLAKKIILLLKNPDKTKQMGKNGRKFIVNNFEWSIISQKYKNLINSLLESR